MRIALAVATALSLAACSKTDAPKAADAAAADAAPPAAAAPMENASTAAPQADPAAGGNMAVKAPHPENSGPLKAGANSFTEGQAKGHIENSGYSNVTGLMRDADGVWHGKAMKGGQTVNVSLDFKGNVVTN